MKMTSFSPASDASCGVFPEDGGAMHVCAAEFDALTVFERGDARGPLALHAGNPCPRCAGIAVVEHQRFVQQPSWACVRL